MILSAILALLAGANTDIYSSAWRASAVRWVGRCAKITTFGPQLVDRIGFSPHEQ